MRQTWYVMGQWNNRSDSENQFSEINLNLFTITEFNSYDIIYTFNLLIHKERVLSNVRLLLCLKLHWSIKYNIAFLKNLDFKMFLEFTIPIKLLYNSIFEAFIYDYLNFRYLVSKSAHYVTLRYNVHLNTGIGY